MKITLSLFTTLALITYLALGSLTRPAYIVAGYHQTLQLGDYHAFESKLRD